MGNKMNKQKAHYLHVKRRWIGANLARWLVITARHRAKRAGIPCTITHQDFEIPTHCPVLRMKLRRGKGVGGARPSSPTLDRIDNRKGYVPGNVKVISFKANMIKNKATAAELRAIARYMESHE